ncbi:MAG: 6-pyruvoyl tetrahydropterin synthase family protein [Planctomycetes bacterium]|nr:6-pyruvoyl tetrahydropterin synthase family protein [Planctomycetota bacterium]
MFSLTVTTEFCAAHALIIAGQREVMHGHNFRVTACVEGPGLDGDGLLCDFHTVESFLQEIIEPFINANLNATPPFDKLNPSAENIAKYLADELHTRLGESLAPAARVAWVSITEAPGCVATYRRD